MSSLIDRFRKPREGRPDPAPSRLTYRIQRWMLTPGIRFGVRFGIPFCLVFVAGAAFMADDARRDRLQVMISDLRASIEERPEFMVNVMAIDGAGRSVAEDIREVVPIDFPISSFDLDLTQIRDEITGLDPVQTADVRIRPGGVLQVTVEERQPAVVWRSREGLALLDANGVHVAELGARNMHPDLPLVAGRSADDAIVEALRLFAVAKPLGPRMRGLVRIGERRWDLVLDRGQRIMLPAENPVPALERVIAVSEVRDLLERDVAAVDMRLAARPTVRMTENAVEDWWRIRQLNAGGL
ncbi:MULTISPECIES: cell division protein FtsQ/DivIB [Phaeobacter]|uniref:Cell division protein FtsQ n=2 Tax=Phaeobacter TaxID=302485 RepID=A0AAC9ZA57_9RHOB|nr:MULTISPECIES: cell division protein FtsQ/DivIB [Phaeobacter]AHD10269.1 Cell division septal protein [Phaeobacter gallaeciensis DSM 26640]ATE93533.1 putative cell division protein FtsQ [Phaeobacter gallaeciensis]ATE96646.1 putative cell division protein FtsQ [Phaeobacter gallaeciensis]ATF02197.1 putative cell division protein FtsQ [Phaeobacter gallaeciensis]ATF06577.1 putative cell division protein FtsQ [Phaeobacter gallaeciensis]